MKQHLLEGEPLLHLKPETYLISDFLWAWKSFIGKENWKKEIFWKRKRFYNWFDDGTGYLMQKWTEIVNIISFACTFPRVVFDNKFGIIHSNLANLWHHSREDINFRKNAKNVAKCFAKIDYNSCYLMALIHC